MNPFIYIGLSITTRAAYRRDVVKSKSNNHTKFINFSCKYFNISYDDVVGKTRLSNIVEVRKIICYYLYNRFHFSLQKVGRLMGNRDHSTVISSIRSFNNLYETDKSFKQKINQFEREI